VCAFSTPCVENVKPRPWWKPNAASRIAMPKVAPTSANTPMRLISALNRTPTTLNVVWIAIRMSVNTRIVFASVASRLVLNSEFRSEEM
jgi:hypothetical protein